MTGAYLSKPALLKELVETNRHLEGCMRLLAAIVMEEGSADPCALGTKMELRITRDQMSAAPIRLLRISQSEEHVRAWLVLPPKAEEAKADE